MTEDSIEPPSGNGRWYNKLTLGHAGFALSVTLAVINAYYALRGSVMMTLPIEQVILYRDGDGPRAALVAAVRVAMINSADSNHGDVLMAAGFSPVKNAVFRQANNVTPVMTSDPKARERCDLAKRCVVEKGLVIIEQGDEIISIPGGGVRSSYLSFPLTRSNCIGKACEGFGDFESSLATYASNKAEPEIRLHFFDDGNRRIKCLSSPLNTAYLRDHGWTTLSCRSDSDALLL